jgi:glycosyltransferase involved in cell wall biosynthesis
MQHEVISKCGGKRLKELSAQSASGGPLFTLVTPVFNGEKRIESTILSVLSQTFSSFEYIVIDGGSTDGTLDLLRKYENVIDYWITEPDLGIYDAMNKAVGLARGQWLYFIGSDDTLCDSLDAVAQYLDDDRTVYYGNVFLTGSQKIYDGKFGPWKLSRRNICQQAIFYPCCLFESEQFSLRYPVAADWEFNMRIYSNHNFRFQHIPVLVANYDNFSGVSAVGPLDERFECDKSSLIRRHLPAACYLLHRIRTIARATVYLILRRPSGRNVSKSYPAKSGGVK